MFQLGLAYALQAEREREIAELIRQRRLLRPTPETATTDARPARSPDPRPTRVGARVPGG